MTCPLSMTLNDLNGRIRARKPMASFCWCASLVFSAAVDGAVGFCSLATGVCPCTPCTVNATRPYNNATARRPRFGTVMRLPRFVWSLQELTAPSVAPVPIEHTWVTHVIHRVSARGVSPGVPLKESRRALVFQGFTSVLLEYGNADYKRCVALFRPDAPSRRLGLRGGILPPRSPRVIRQSVIQKTHSGPRGNWIASVAGCSKPVARRPGARPGTNSEASMVRRFNRFLFIFIPSALLFAQSETATLRGTITDNSGAPIPNIQLVLFESGKELSVREVSTGSGGRYTAPFLRPGSYPVKIDANHFQTFQAEGILLVAGQEGHFDAQLKPEARDETVLLDEKSTPQQTHTGTVDGIIDFKRAWQDAPFVDLHPSALPLLTQAPATQGNTLGNQTGLVISGVSARNQQTWALNGVAQDTTTQTGNPAFFETMEVAIATTGVDAAKPVQVQMISKHGSDGIHGQLYYKRGSSGFNAKSYFDASKSSYKISEAAGELSGAVVPHWTYFYGGGMYQKTPYSEILFADVPTTQMRAVDFSQFLNPQIAPNGKVVVVRDPKNGVPFPNNVMPSNRLALVSSHYQSTYYPLANAGTANTFTQNYTWTD